MLVRAVAQSEHPDIVLDAVSSAFSAATVEFAFFFESAASVPDLTTSLASVLQTFVTLGGRLARQDGRLVVKCSNAGVPFTHIASDEAPPSLSEPLASGFFDIVCDSIPSDGDGPADALARVKLTTFASGEQLMALSVSHAIADARSLGSFVHAWSAAFKGQPLPSISFDGSKLPVAPAAFGAPPLVSSEGIPDSWKDHHPPFGMPSGTPYAPAVITYERSSSACKSLKERLGGADGAALSTNDVLCGELARVLGSTSVSFVVDLREACGLPNYFGVAIATQDAVADSPADVASAMRRVVPFWRERGFVEWKVGQGAGGCATVTFNSWARAFRLAELCFAGPASAMMLGESMCRSRLKAFAVMGLPYVIILPQRDGVSVCLMGPAELCSQIEGARCVKLDV
jgi:hypothetical protein